MRRVAAFRRLLVCGAGASLLAAVIAASAATLGGIGAAPLGAGDAIVNACDSDGMTVAYTTLGGAVTAVTASGLADPACEGGALSLTLKDATGAALASGGPVTVPTDGNTAENAATVTVSPQPDASQVQGIAIQIVGP